MQKGVHRLPTRVFFVSSLVYGAVGLLSLVLFWNFDIPFLAPSGPIPSPAAHLVSSGLGLVAGALTLLLTRSLVSSVSWARSLHADLRFVVHRQPTSILLLASVQSAIAEELFFRGVLLSLLGRIAGLPLSVLATSLLFGFMHQIRGRGRWGWMIWATAMGFVFALLAATTGSLAGPLVAHALVNFQNLKFLRDHDPTPPEKESLGGLLG